MPHPDIQDVNVTSKWYENLTGFIDPKQKI